MRIPGRNRLTLAVRRLRNRFRPGPLILLYHRIAESPLDPFKLDVSPAHFAEQLEVLSRHARPMSLAELTRALRERRVPERAVAVTFDDGYDDNLRVAKPLLERHDIPATVFVTTGTMGEEFWWDELTRIVCGWPRLPTRITPAPDGLRIDRAPDAATGLARRAPTPAERTRVARSLLDPLVHEPPRVRETALERIRAEGARALAAPRHRCMTPDEILRLADGGSIEIGAHTVTHTNLSVLTPEARRVEILDSQARLAEILGRPVRSFSYPHGIAPAGAHSILEAGGFAHALTTRFDTASPGVDRFHLPRMTVADQDGDAFARWLADWLRG